MNEHEIPYTAELQRKALHLLALLIPFGMAVAGRTASIWILTPLALLCIAADVLRVRSKPFADWLYRYFGFMMRPEERPPFGSRPVLNGATWVLVSAAILAILFPLTIAVPAFAAFMIADAAAAVVGRRFGRRRWGATTRTLEGSTAFVIVGILVMVPFPSISLWTAVASVIPGAAAEIPSRPLNDNLRVPLVMAAVIALIRFLTT